MISIRAKTTLGLHEAVERHVTGPIKHDTVLVSQSSTTMHVQYSQYHAVSREIKYNDIVERPYKLL